MASKGSRNTSRVGVANLKKRLACGSALWNEWSCLLICVEIGVNSNSVRMHVRGTGVSHTVPFLRVAISRGLSIENLNTCAHVCGNAQYDENAMFVEGSCRVFFRYEIVATLLREKGCHDANVKLLMTKLKKKI